MPVVIIFLVVTVSMLSDLFTNAVDDTRIDASGTLVTLLASLAFYVLWTRSTFAFVAMVPALIASHLLESLALMMLALPVMLGFVAATATRRFSVVALGAAVLWSVFIPVSFPDSADAMWMALALIGVAWAIGNFVRVMVERRHLDQVRVAEATRRAAMAAAEERRSLARDLHDIVAHNLTIISMQARAAKYAGTDDAARHAVDVVGDSASEALADLRRMLSLLQAEGLVAGGRDAAQIELGDGAASLDLEYGAVKFSRMLEGLGVETEVTLEGMEQDIPQSVETALYRVLQEAVTNVAKHAAEGGQCRICIRVHEGHLELAVDNTLPRRGEPARVGSNSSGSGLIGMRDRVVAFGGTMSSVRDGNWWRLRAEVPLQDVRP